MTIRTERLIIRPFTDADADTFAAMNADPQVMRYFLAPLTRAESDGFLQRIADHHRLRGYSWMAVEHEGELIGMTGLAWAEFLGAVEIGWRFRTQFHNRGFATEAARAVAHWGFHTLGFEEIVAFTVPENQASRRVMERIGMKHDPASDFDHPRIPDGHRFKRHVLYRLRAGDLC